MKAVQLDFLDEQKPIPPATAQRMLDAIPPNREKLFVFETAGVLRCSRGQVYKHIDEGSLIAFHNESIHARRPDYRIWVWSLKEFLAKRTEGAR